MVRNLVNQNIEASEETVEAIVKYILEKLDEYLKTHTCRDIDVFMAIHGVHKYIVKDMARRWEPGIPERKTFRMADLTFRRAMRDLR